MAFDNFALTLFQPPTGSAGGDLLNTLQGGGGSASVSTNPLPALKLALANRAVDITRQSADPQVKRDLAAFTKGIAKAKTPASALADPAVLKVLLTANGLGDQAAYPALARKALLADPSQAGALVNRLSDTRWKTVAATYQFAARGLAVIQTASVQQTLSNAYAEVLWRQSLDATTPGLSNAISFRDQAAKITSVDQILGDKTLRAVVTTALGIPQQIAFQEIGAQEKSITSRLDLKRLGDPRFVDAFTQRYLLATQNASSATQNPSLDSLAVHSAGLIV